MTYFKVRLSHARECRYLSSIAVVERDPLLLAQLGVRRVISIVERRPHLQSILRDNNILQHLLIELADCNDSAQKLSLRFVEICNFIAAQPGAVLVHCEAGQSRSPAVVLAFLVHHFRVSLPNAFRFLQSVKLDAFVCVPFLSILVFLILSKATADHSPECVFSASRERMVRYRSAQW